MTVATEVLAVKVLNVAAGVPVPVNYPLYSANEVFVYYGKGALLAQYNVDYTITLGAAPNFYTFTLVPLASLITKINALIALDPTEVNFVTIRRELPLLTASTPSAVANTTFTSREVDRITLKLQQLREALLRSLVLPPTYVGFTQLTLPLPEIGKGIGWNSTGTGFVNVELSPGPPGPSETFDTLLHAASQHPVLAANFMRTAGYLAVGDGGGALYKKVTSEPSHAGKFFITLSVTLEVVWYQIAEFELEPRMFGAVGANVNVASEDLPDDTTAVLNTFAVANALIRPIRIRRKYMLKQQIVYSNAPLTVRGSGQWACQLVWAADAGSTGLRFNSNNDKYQFLLEDFSLTTFKAHEGTAFLYDGTGQIVDQGAPGPSDEDVIAGREKDRGYINRVAAYGAGNALGSGWAFGLDLLSPLNVYIDHFNFLGHIALAGPLQDPLSNCGILARGVGHPVVVVVTNSVIGGCDSAVEFAGIEGGFVSGCNLIGNDKGVFWNDGAGRPHLSIEHSHIAAFVTCIDVLNAAQVNINGVNLGGSLASAAATITGVAIRGPNSRYGSIVACDFEGPKGFTGGTGPNFNAIAIEAGHHFVIDANKFRDVDVGVWFSSTDAHDNILTGDNTWGTVRATKVIDSGVSNSQPGLMARMNYAGAAQAVSAGPAYVVLFDTDVEKVGNFYEGVYPAPSPGTPVGRITIPCDGVYEISAGVSWQIAAGTYRGLELYLNGATIPLAAPYISAVAGRPNTQTVQGIRRCVKGDYFEVVVVSSDATTVLANPRTFFKAVKVD